MNILKKWWFWVIAAVVIVVTISSGNSKKESPTSNDTPNQSQRSSNNTENNDSNTYKAEETITFKGKEVTVTKVERNYNTGNSYIEPSEGKEFVKVTVSIKNVSDSNIEVSPFDFKIQSSDGALKEITFSTYSLEDEFESAELIPGGIRIGALLFEVPKNDANLKLVYNTHSMFSNKRLTIEL